MLSEKEEFNTLYVVFEARIYKHKILASPPFTDGAGTGKLVEIEYKSSSPFDANDNVILSFIGITDTYSKRETNRFYTLCVKEAIREALGKYRFFEQKHGGTLAQSIPTYFGKYFDDFPELFI